MESMTWQEILPNNNNSSSSSSSSITNNNETNGNNRRNGGRNIINHNNGRGGGGGGAGGLGGVGPRNGRGGGVNGGGGGDRERNAAAGGGVAASSSSSSPNAPTIKNHSVTHFGDYLYCFGGYDGRRNHATLLLYSLKEEKWIRPIHVPDNPVPPVLDDAAVNNDDDDNDDDNHNNNNGDDNSTGGEEAGGNNEDNGDSNNDNDDDDDEDDEDHQMRQEEPDAAEDVLVDNNGDNDEDEDGDNNNDDRGVGEGQERVGGDDNDAFDRQHADRHQNHIRQPQLGLPPHRLGGADIVPPPPNDPMTVVLTGNPPPGRNGHSATLAVDPDDPDCARIIIVGGWLGTGPLAASDMHVLHIRNNTNESYLGGGGNDDDGDHDVDDRMIDDSDEDTVAASNNSGRGATDEAADMVEREERRWRRRVARRQQQRAVAAAALQAASDHLPPARPTLRWTCPSVRGTPPGPCNMHSADYVKKRQEVYVFRGGNGREYLNDLHALCTSTYVWRRVETTGEVPQQRANHSSAVLDETGELFIFGGWNGTERLNVRVLFLFFSCFVPRAYIPA